MMLAFSVDQIQLLACPLMQKAREVARTYRNLWEKLRSLVDLVHLESWQQLLSVIAKRQVLRIALEDSS